MSRPSLLALGSLVMLAGLSSTGCGRRFYGDDAYYGGYGYRQPRYHRPVVVRRLPPPRFYGRPMPAPVVYPGYAPQQVVVQQQAPAPPPAPASPVHVPPGMTAIQVQAGSQVILVVPEGSQVYSPNGQQPVVQQPMHPAAPGQPAQLDPYGN